MERLVDPLGMEDQADGQQDVHLVRKPFKTIYFFFGIKLFAKKNILSLLNMNTFVDHFDNEK